MLPRTLYTLLALPVFALAATANSDNMMEAQQIIFGEGRESAGASNAEMQTFDKPSLSDLLTVDRSLSVFYDYVRQSSTLMRRLTLGGSTTIFAPRDSAIMSLHRKPHEGPVDEAGSIGRFAQQSEEEQDKAMLAFLEKWTSAHMVDGADHEIKAGSELESLAGDDAKVRFTAIQDGGEQDWEQVLVQPGDARILSTKEARDGRLYVIDHVLQ